MKRKHVYLDGNDIEDMDDFHREIAKLLNFPKHYGHNLDAMWDFLSDGLGMYTTLHWKNSNISREKLSQFNGILKVFERNRKMDNDFELDEEERFDYILE